MNRYYEEEKICMVCGHITYPIEENIEKKQKQKLLLREAREAKGDRSYHRNNLTKEYVIEVKQLFILGYTIPEVSIVTEISHKRLLGIYDNLFYNNVYVPGYDEFVLAHQQAHKDSDRVRRKINLYTLDINEARYNLLANRRNIVKDLNKNYSILTLSFKYGVSRQNISLIKSEINRFRKSPTAAVVVNA